MERRKANLNSFDIDLKNGKIKATMTVDEIVMMNMKSDKTWKENISFIRENPGDFDNGFILNGLHFFRKKDGSYFVVDMIDRKLIPILPEQVVRIALSSEYDIKNIKPFVQKSCQ